MSCQINDSLWFLYYSGLLLKAAILKPCAVQGMNETGSSVVNLPKKKKKTKENQDNKH